MARKQPKVWRSVRQSPRPEKPDDHEKRVIVEACETFIREVLKPRFLRKLDPADEAKLTGRNYVIDIHGVWSAGRYRFVQRYRATADNRIRDEFDAPFARIDRTGPDRFDIKWMRHTGQWWPLYSDKTLTEALHILETDEVLFPY